MTIGRPHEVICTIEMEPHVGFGSHWHDTAQLVWPRAGTMRVICEDRSWLLGPTTAAWIPSRSVHDVVAGSSGCTFRSVYLRERSPERPATLALDPLLVGIIDELDRSQDVDGAERARLEMVMFDRVRRGLLASDPVGSAGPLPFPRDERAVAIASALLDRLNDPRDLDSWGRTVGASGRTLRRIWRHETGMSFRQWRTTARLRHAYELLVDGSSLRAVAHSVGYVSQNAFSDAFAAHHHVRPSEVRRGAAEIRT